MKIVIASDSFKGSMSSMVVAQRIEAGIRKVLPDAEIIKLPIADGGEGTVEALVESAGGQYKTVPVTGPLGGGVDAVYGILNNGTAVIEMAAAAGLPLLSESERNPMLATTRGVGEMVLAALNEGCRKIIIGLGGSATNDGGVGMAQALGASFLDEQGNALEAGGGSLMRLHSIDVSGMDKRIGETEIILASDVRAPLCGPKGASYVFSPQKGADDGMVQMLEDGLAHLSAAVQSQLGIDVAHIPGAGAAGGLGYGFLAFCGASIQSGIDTILDAMEFEKHLTGCSLVITGEGKIDGQSAYGKVPVGIGMRAKKRNLPVLAMVGDMGEGAHAVYEHGITSIMSTVNRAMPLSEAIANGALLLEDAAERAMRMCTMLK